MALRNLLRVLASGAAACCALAAGAQTLEISGSTSVVKALVQPNVAAIREATGVAVSFHAMPAGRGMIALFEGKAGMAAVSEGLEASVASARQAMAESGIEAPVPANLVYQEVGRERVAVYLHKDNPVVSLSQAQLRDLFSGKVRNWKELGGPDLPVKIFLSSAGSATRSIMQRQVLGGGAFAPSAAEFRTGLAAMEEVGKERGGIAASGLTLLDHAKTPNIKVAQTAAIERPHGFVTVGPPGEPARKVLDFLRRRK